MKKIIILVLLFSVAAFAASVDLTKCTGCHGKNFEKKALGKSKVVSEMTRTDVSNSLIGYKNGTYGGVMKKLMEKQVEKYSDQELKNTNLGKLDLKVILLPTKEEYTIILFSDGNKYAYKYKDTCWIVDYDNKKSKITDCNTLSSRKNYFPPNMPSIDGVPRMENGLFQGII